MTLRPAFSPVARTNAQTSSRSARQRSGNASHVVVSRTTAVGVGGVVSIVTASSAIGRDSTGSGEREPVDRGGKVGRLLDDRVGGGELVGGADAPGDTDGGESVGAGAGDVERGVPDHHAAVGAQR